MTHVFVQLFRDIGPRREDTEIEMLDRQALRARIGEPMRRASEGRCDDVIPLRTDGPRPSAPRSWRDAAGLPR